MRYTITEEDKLLFSQGSLDYKYRFSVMKGSQIVDVLYGVSQAGTYGINGESDIRRTLNFTLTLDEFHTNIEEKYRAGSDWISNLKSVYTAFLTTIICGIPAALT